MINMKVIKNDSIINLKNVVQDSLETPSASTIVGVAKGAVEQFSSTLAFPSVGKIDMIYIDMSTNKSYRWDLDNSNYYIIGSDYTDIKVISGGDATWE